VYLKLAFMSVTFADTPVHMYSIYRMDCLTFYASVIREWKIMEILHFHKYEWERGKTSVHHTILSC
jgi:hypothetical protein